MKQLLHRLFASILVACLGVDPLVASAYTQPFPAASSLKVTPIFLQQAFVSRADWVGNLRFYFRRYVQPDRKLIGHYFLQERRTNPTMEHYTHVGRAMPVYEVPFPKMLPYHAYGYEAHLISQFDREAEQKFMQFLVHDNRLLTDFSNSKYLQVLHYLKSQKGYLEVAPEYTPKAMDALKDMHHDHDTNISVYFDADRKKLVAGLTSDFIHTVRVTRDEVLERCQKIHADVDVPSDEKDILTQGLVNAIEAHALLQDVEFAYELNLSMPAFLNFQIQEGLDYVELDPDISYSHGGTIYLPANRVPRAGDRKSSLRFKADLMSELRDAKEILRPDHSPRSDEQTEPESLWAFVASEGIQAALLIHKDYVQKETEKAANFASRIVHAIESILQDQIPEDFSEQTQLLKTYESSIFHGLWDKLPHRKILEYDKHGILVVRTRILNPTQSAKPAHLNLEANKKHPSLLRRVLSAA